jgi:hypothetical protein
MSEKEKAHLSGGPIPNYVCQDSSENTALQLQLQVSLLVRRVGIDAGTAAMLAPMVFGVLA